MTETSLSVAIATLKRPWHTFYKEKRFQVFWRGKFENHLTRQGNKENLLQKFQINHKYKWGCTEFGKVRERTSNSGFQRRWLLTKRCSFYLYKFVHVPEKKKPRGPN